MSKDYYEILGVQRTASQDDIRTAVDRIRVNLPAAIDPPNVQRVEFNDGDEVLTYSVSSAAMSARTASRLRRASSTASSIPAIRSATRRSPG